MDFSDRLNISYYETISTINEEHHIYLARHRESGRIFVKKELAVYNIDIYRYLYEHPATGIPRIYALCEDEGVLIVIEEYISGESLADRLAKPDPIDLKTARQILCSLCDILTPLHEANPPIVHRDIKPANILLTDDNRVFLLDYNAAKYYDSKSTSDTTLLGTQGYAAPEQYGFGSSSPRTDIYAIGVMMRDFIENNEDLSGSLSPIANRCLRIDPGKRYASAAALKKAITSYNSLMPPGFRQKKLWHMLIAIPVYLFVIYFSASLNVTGLPAAALPTERVIFLLWLLGLIALGCNYPDIWHHLPLCRSYSPIVRIIGIIIWGIVYSVSILLAIVILEVVVFGYS